MKRKPYPLVDMTGGLNVGTVPFLLADPQSPANLDCWYDKGILKKLPGVTEYSPGTDVSGQPMYLDTYWPSTGSAVNLMLTQTNTYAWNATNLEWDDITYETGSPAVAVPWTGELYNRFSACHLNELLVVTNGVDDMQKFNGTAMALLGGTPPKLRSITAYKNRIVGVYAISGSTYPTRIQWSVIGDPEDWTSVTSGYIDLVDTVDACVCIKTLGEYAYIFKERTIWRLRYIGGTRVFVPELVIDGVGTYAPDSICYLEDRLIFKGNEGMYIFDGQRLESISDPIFPPLAQTGVLLLNKSAEWACTGIVLQEVEEYWFSFPTVSDTPDTLYRYSLKHKSWLQSDDYEAVCFGYGYVTSDPTAWSALVGDWTAWEGSWKKSSLRESEPFTLIAEADGTLQQYDMTQGSSREMVWNTKDFIFGQALRLAYVQLRARYGTFYVSHSTDEGRTWSSEVAFSASGVDWREYQYFLYNVTTVAIRFRIRTTATRFELAWVEVWYIDRVRSENIYAA